MSTVKTIRVCAAVLDNKRLTLHLADGSSLEIKQGDERLRTIVEKVVPEIRSQGYSDIEVPDKSDVYSQVEKKTNGLLKFFRIARNKLNEIFHINNTKEEVAPFDMVGNTGAISEQTKQSIKDAQVIDEIISNAIPADHVHFEDVPTNTTDQSADKNIHEENGDTIIAIVDGTGVVEDAHKIKHQLVHAVSTGNTEGVENFYRRMAEVAKKRRHTAKDLFQFCMKGDLQFANDGSIIVYKSLREVFAGANAGWFVDIHSGRVTQNVGTRVFMEESMVDHNRRNECSNGLHIARRQYVGTFSGDALFICRIAPEDVIAVPEYDANKMRVCAYDVIFKLNKQDEQAVRKNKPVYTEEGLKMIAAAINGNFPPMHRFVEIRGQYGTNLHITTTDDVPQEVDISNEEGVSPLDYDADSYENTDEPVNVEQVAEAVQQGREKPKTKKEIVAELYVSMVAAPHGSVEKYEIAKEIEAIKKKAKISWMNLMSENEADDVLNVLSNKPEGLVEPEVEEAPVEKEEPALTEQERINQLTQLSVPQTDTTPRVRIATLMLIVRGSDNDAAAKAWDEVKAVKKAAKKSWEYFGITDVELLKLNGRFSK